MKLYLSLAALAALSTSAWSQIGPSAYLQTSDSPWAASVGSSTFYLENFEDGLFNTPGVTASAGAPLAPGGLTDSVDGDDGNIDGFGTAGRSFFFNDGTTGIRFTFTSGTYGNLPTHAGVVWTDGANAGRFEAFDQNNVSLGTISGTPADNSFGGTTGEDRFFGWVHGGGIKSILITSPGGGIEVDHLQYGAVPEPATMTVLGLGLASLVARRRRK